MIKGHSCGGPGQAVFEILTLSQVSQGPSHSPIPSTLSQGSFADTTHVGEGIGVPSPPTFVHRTPKQLGEAGAWASAHPSLPLLQACSPGLSRLAILSPDCLWPWYRWNSAGGLVLQGSWRIRGAEAGSPRANRLSGLAGWAGRVPSPSSRPCKATTFFLSPPSPFLPPQAPGEGLPRNVSTRLTTAAAPGGAGTPVHAVLLKPSPPWQATGPGAGLGTTPSIRSSES